MPQQHGKKVEGIIRDIYDYKMRKKSTFISLLNEFSVFSLLSFPHYSPSSSLGSDLFLDFALFQDPAWLCCVVMPTNVTNFFESQEMPGKEKRMYELNSCVIIKKKYSMCQKARHGDVEIHIRVFYEKR